MTTPRQVFDAWRDNDLFGFDPPKEDESYQEYHARVGDEALASDRLFHFALAELCGEELSRDEADRRLLRAVEDLEAVSGAEVTGRKAKPVRLYKSRAASEGEDRHALRRFSVPHEYRHPRHPCRG